MTYYQELQKAKEAKINIFDITIASTTEDVLNNAEVEYNEEIFNKACGIVKDNYLKASNDTTIDMVVEALLKHTDYDLIAYDTSFGIENIGKSELLDEIEY